MKPTVEIDIKGKKYTLEATFDLFSQIEQITGTGLYEILHNPKSLKLNWIKEILILVLGDQISEHDLKEWIFSNYDYVLAKMITLLSVGFTNPNPRAKDLKSRETIPEPEKKK